MGKFVIKGTKNGGFKFDLLAVNQQIIANSQVYKDKAGEFRFRLRASNGQIILTGEGYSAKAGCLNGIDSIGRNAPDAEVVKEE